MRDGRIYDVQWFARAIVDPANGFDISKVNYRDLARHVDAEYYPDESQSNRLHA